VNSTRLLSREVEGNGPMKPGNQTLLSRCQFRQSDL
jgi:hypothetical protein